MKRRSSCFLILVTGTVFVIWFGAMLAPAIASLIIAFILQGLVTKLTKLGVPEVVSIVSVFPGPFLGVLVGVTFGLLPLIWTQLRQPCG